ncbi:hypothetical protein M430DRAFT_96237 [Amorphotheca resinae ATCC 22711]|uniref:Nucleotide exchange factor SIL1 n=1 Tax=Amorphotheca resinae ATCC 22711 TaxID=857342 RepID=A0A2T3BA33_AMORE|nr:hypothetical protein M430DRAFT_96237 [Amorphotheca resinae ATCC 22711]PSS25183.1 hypothetical protein M430DRAFT_96237 [Amorphotheca resinae ATCC 22711]
MVYISLRSLLGLACLSLPIIAEAASAPAEPSASPAADTDLICPTNHAGDCYPRVFQATEDFQIIRDGQDIPSGLHVRLNVYTGEREARLNIPMEGEDGATIEEAPTEQAMVVVEQPEPESEEYPALRDQVPQKPPPYEAAGKIRPPEPTDGGEIGTFNKAKLIVSMEGRAFDPSLDDLSELAHDIYYGVEIAKDGPVLEKLLCLALGSGSDRFPAKENKRDHKAASILASAIQNNPTALGEVAKMGRIVLYPNCGAELTGSKTRGDGGFVSILRNRLGREKEPSSLKAKVSLISGLIKEPRIRDEFLQTGGMELLLAIWLKKGEQWDPVRMKVAQLVMDNLLDENMGATLGIWPKKPVSEKSICETKGRMLEDGCWEYHVESFLEASPESSWADDFLKILREQRARLVNPIPDREL